MLGRAGIDLCGSPSRVISALEAELRGAFTARECVLTDSGTSALVLALRTLVPKGGVIALPGYGCVDITSAVQYAGVKVRLYDMDPRTLSPNLDSLQHVLRLGVDAVLVAHYYGYPADMTGVRALASRAGVPVLEDAAQAAGGSLHGQPLGSLGDVSILSFGRGKGLFGGHGGALLIRSHDHTDRISSQLSSATRRGASEWCSAVLQWALGRPSLYGIPASIPALRLGEMIYRPAHEPRGLSIAAASLVRSALKSEAAERIERARRAAVLRALTDAAKSLTPIQPIGGADPGYLRFGLLDVARALDAAPRLGAMRGYPQTLREQRELEPHLLQDERRTPGADELQRSLFTLPTHCRVTWNDMTRLEEWMAKADRASQRTSPVAAAHAPAQELFQGASR
jgi:perosamine synthetase